uniref:Uncharacterized protein n=1 Tax=Cucumis melo TaxID=3656 RepID=A0A9I9DC58_CUCME
MDQVGERGISGAGATSIKSGFGGLGLEGMVGKEDGGRVASPGVGKSGEMSDDGAGAGENSGAAEMEEVMRYRWVGK